MTRSIGATIVLAIVAAVAPAAKSLVNLTPSRKVTVVLDLRDEDQEKNKQPDYEKRQQKTLSKNTTSLVTTNDTCSMMNVINISGCIKPTQLMVQCLQKPVLK